MAPTRALNLLGSPTQKRSFACVSTFLTQESIMGIGDMLQAERDAEDAKRYRWLRAHWSEMTGIDWRADRAAQLDQHIDKRLAADTEVQP